MFNYLKGKIVGYGSNYVTLDNNGIGFLIYVANPFVYKENTEYTIYIYTHVREEEFTLYGFRNEQERDFFVRLLNVKGVGPRLALPILASPTDAVYDAIESRFGQSTVSQGTEGAVALGDNTSVSGDGSVAIVSVVTLLILISGKTNSSTLLPQL